MQRMAVVITGSSRGIGLALAKAFASAGARVCLNGRDADELERASQSLNGVGPEVITVKSDVSTVEGSAHLIDTAWQHFGKVDLLINNAGTMGSGNIPVWEVENSEWEQVLSVNLMAALHCSATLARRSLVERIPVRILNVSSGIVGHGMTHLGPYAISKDALEGLTRAYGWDANDGLVCVASIQPRSVSTQMTQTYFGRTNATLMDEPDVLAPVFLWAATAPAAEVHGRSFSEPAFAVDPEAAKSLRGPLLVAPPIVIHPKTFEPDSDAGEQPGAYMHLLENAFGYYPSAADALHASLHDRKLHAYPDPAYRELKHAIASEAAVAPDAIALGPGSSDIINRILQMFCRPGDTLLMTKPSWSFFNAFVQRWQLIPRRVPMIGSLKDGSLRHDLAGLVNAITPDTRLMYLVNPCNPTGSMASPEELYSAFAALPSHLVVVLDEAYIQYAEPALRPDIGKLLAICPARLIVLRTFSKFFGLSGHRVGYAIARDDTIRLLAKSEMPFGITSSAATVVPAVLADTAFRDQVFQTNKSGREQLAEGLSQLGLNHLPSQTNFILFDSPTDPDRLRADLLQRGMVLPSVDQFLRNYSLLAVGQAEHNEIVLETLSRY